MSIMVASGKGAETGVLFKNAEAIEVLRQIDTLVVDKTGTLTEGKPKLVSLIALPEHDEQSLLRLAVALERSSEHPLAAAIVAEASARGIDQADTRNFASITGKGIKGEVDGRQVSLGNRALATELSIDTEKFE